MMRFIRIFAVFAGLLVAGVVAIGTFVDSIDLTEHSDVIARQVRKATGRNLTFSGTAELTLSLTPTITVSEVSFENAEWGSRSQMVSAKSVAAQIDLLELISGSIIIERLVLVEPGVLLETNAEGLGNWDFKTARESDGGATTSFPGASELPSIREILIKDGRLTYKDGQAGKTSTLLVNRLSVRADDKSSPLRIAFTGGYEGNSFSAEGVLGPLAQLASEGLYPINIRAEAGGARLTIDGEIRQPLALTGLDLVIGARGDEVATLSSFVGAKLPAFGPYDVRLRLTDQDGPLQISSLSAELGRKGEEYATVTGSIGDVLAPASLDLSLTIEGRDLAALGRFVNIDMPPTGPVTVTGSLTDPNGIYTFRDFRATAGQSDLAGNVSINMALTRPLLVTEVTSSLFDLVTLLPLAGATTTGGVGSNGGVRSTVQPDRLFSDMPLPLKQLGTTDVTLKFRGKRVSIKGFEFENVALELSLKRGKLAVHLVNSPHGGSELFADVSIDSQPVVPNLRAKVDVNRMDIKRLLTELQITDLVEGQADIAIDVYGSGNSVRAIMGTLSGDLSLVMGEGRIDSGYVDLLAVDLVQTILAGSPAEGYTEFNCFVSRFELADGIATDRGILFDTRHMTVAGGGDIDLRSEEVELILKPQPKDPSLFSLATPLRVSGTLANLHLVPDSLAVAKDVAVAAIAVLATGGIGLLVPFVSAGSGDDNPCITALSGVQSAAVPGDVTTSQTPQAPSQENEEGDLGDLLEGIGNAFRGLFGID